MSSPGYRAAMDRAAAYAIDAVTRRAHDLDHLDSSEEAGILRRMALDRGEQVNW